VPYPKGLEVIDNAFDSGPELIDYLDTRDLWSRSEIGEDRHHSDTRTSSTCFLPFLSYDHPPVVHDFGRTIWQLLQNYGMVYGVSYYRVEPMTFNRYEPGQHFSAHPDYFKGSDRVVSAVAYLNTVTDGGTTRFVHFGTEVEAVAGRVVLFPSNYLFAHEGTAPTTDVKYSAAFWARG